MGGSQLITDLALLYDYCLDARSHANIIGIVPGHAGWLIPSSAEVNEELNMAF